MDEMDELDHPESCKYRFNCVLWQCNCIEEECEQILVLQSLVIRTNDEAKQFNIIKFMNSLFTVEKAEWKQNKNRCGVAKNCRN